MKDPDPSTGRYPERYPDKQAIAAYVRRREADVRRLAGDGDIAFTDEYVYRPGQMLVSAEDDERVGRHLRQWGCRPDEAMNEELAGRGLNLRRWLLAENQPVPDVVARVRRVERSAKPLIAGPNHIFGSEPRWNWGGGGIPMAAAAFPVDKDGGCGSDEVAIGVLDTGVAADTELLHSALFGQLSDVTGDIDKLDDDSDGFLDSGAGHGTFVLGVLHRLVPALRYDVEPVLGAHGMGDDLSVAIGVSEITGNVINLSFGGYTHDNMEPPGLRAALEKLGEDRVVVAAAGNHGLSDPFWPAAFANVVAVAAVDTRDPDAVRPAWFTNRGEWVDICAPGVDIHSSYVRGAWPGGDSFDGHARWSGTSFAAPQVAAAIAALAAERGITAGEALGELIAGLSPLPDHPELGLLYLPPKDLVYRG